MRLIDADELRNELTSICSDKVNDYNKAVKAFIEFIDNTPTVDPRIEYGTDGQPYKLSMTNGKEYERPTGEWKQISPAKIYECTNCGQTVMTGDIECYQFCHNCGADMREGGAE